MDYVLEIVMGLTTSRPPVLTRGTLNTIKFNRRRSKLNRQLLIKLEEKLDNIKVTEVLRECENEDVKDIPIQSKSLEHRLKQLECQLQLTISELSDVRHMINNMDVLGSSNSDYSFSSINSSVVI